MTTTQVKTGTTGIQTPKDDNVQTVLKQLKEVAEVGQRLRGDPMNSFVRVADLVNNNMARLVNGQVKPPLTTGSSGGGGGSGTVTSITAGTGLSGGTITVSGTIALANTAVTPGSYTNMNATVDAQGRLTAASNGSGSSGANITPDTHPASPSAWDDEFETGSSINLTQWTKSAPGTATTSLVSGSLIMLMGASTGEELYSQVPPTSGTWEFTIKTLGGMTASIIQGFLCLRNTSNLKEIIFGMSGATLLVQRQTFVSTTVSPTFSATPFSSSVGNAPWIYLKIAWNGTSYIFSYSFSGLPNTYVVALTEASATWVGTTPLAIGFGNQGNLAGIIDWFRRTA